MILESYTNSSCSCFRSCPRKAHLQYGQRLERIGENHEALRVGDTWHKAHDARAKRPAEDHAPYEAIARHAPSELWREKLARLFSAYDWRWASHPLALLESEVRFKYHVDGSTREGQIDGVIEIDGKVGNLERKTTSEDLADTSPFWQRQRMGTQVSGYEIAFEEKHGRRPDFTLYDVVRKPSIRPKGLTKKDVARLRSEVDSNGFAFYFGERMDAQETESALHEGRETLKFFGARLTADIGDRPDWYFQRRIIHRTAKDLDDARDDLRATISMIEAFGDFMPRNPDSCTAFGLCDFFELCANGEYPRDYVPAGFRRREHLHPELHDFTEDVA